MTRVVPHMVIFRRPEGKPGYHQAENVEDAIRFVEMLRNQENVTDAHIFRMEEVPIEIRTVYKVELAPSGADAPTPAPVPHAPNTPSTPTTAGTPNAPNTPSTLNGGPPIAPAAAAPEPANGDAAELGPQDVFEPPVPVATAKGRRFNRG